MKLHIFLYSTAVNPISAYVLSKYFELEPPLKYKNISNNYDYENIAHTEKHFYKFIQKNKDNLTIELINKYFNKLENALNKIIDSNTVIPILVPCNNSNSNKAKLIIDKLIQGVSTTGVKCPKIPIFHKYRFINSTNTNSTKGYYNLTISKSKSKSKLKSKSNTRSK